MRGVCILCNGDRKIMAVTGDPLHPLKAVPCPRCCREDGRRVTTPQAQGVKEDDGELSNM